MKEQVFEHLLSMYNERQQLKKSPHYVTFRQLAERKNIVNMMMYLRQLISEKRVEAIKTLSDIGFAPLKNFQNGQM